MENLYFILDGKNAVEEKDIIQWAEWFERSAKDGSRVVKFTELPNNVRVSTVFLGLNHQWFPEGPPLLFETMIFGGGNDYQERYATWEEAEKGHDHVLHEYFKVDSDVR
jgi:hypothetical protein